MIKKSTYISALLLIGHVHCFLRWKAAKTETERKTVENDRDNGRIPLSEWPALCAFFDSDAKKLIMVGSGKASSILSGPSKGLQRKKRKSKSLQEVLTGEGHIQMQQMECTIRDGTMRSSDSNESRQHIHDNFRDISQNHISTVSNMTGEWSNQNPIDVVWQAQRTGVAPNTSDALTINGQPGDLYNCSSQDLELGDPRAVAEALARSRHGQHIHDNFGDITQNHTNTTSNMTASPTEFKRRSYRPHREAQRLAARIDRYGVTSQAVKCVGGKRGPNKPQNLMPDFSKGEGKRPIYWNQNSRPHGKFAGVFSMYRGFECSNYARYPLHMNWGSEHKKNFDRFFIEMQDYYEFFGPLHPEDEKKEKRLPWNEEGVREYLRTSMQRKVIDRRSLIKNDYFLRWKAARNQMERKAIENDLDYGRIPLTEWPALCAFLDSDAKKAQSKRNAANRNSNKNDSAMYTGGSNCMSRAAEKVIEKRGADNCTEWDVWLATHTTIDIKSGETIYPNESTRRYADKVRVEIQNRSLELSNGSDLSNLSPVLDAVSSGHHGGYERGLGLGPTRRKLKNINKETRLERELKEKCIKLEAEKKHLEVENKHLKEQLEDSTQIPGTIRSEDSMAPQGSTDILKWLGSDVLDVMYEAALRARNTTKDQAVPNDLLQHDDNL